MLLSVWAHSGRPTTRARFGVLLALFLAHTLFLWMFFAAAALEQMADMGRISESKGADTREVAYAFAAQWRHGMTDGWLLYMPGFFVTAIITWFWCVTRTVPRLLAEGVATIALATVAAVLSSPAGAARVIEAFQLKTGLECQGALPGAPTVAVLLGLFTLISWKVFIVAGQRAVANRSFRPMLLPLVLGVGLAASRPVTVGDFTSFWAQRVLQGDPVAITSAILAIVSGVFLVRRQLRASVPSPAE